MTTIQQFNKTGISNMDICNRCKRKIIWKQSKKGKWYTVNEDNSFHSNTCTGQKPDNPDFKQNQPYDGTPLITTADELLDNKNIENARWFIDNLNLRLIRKKLELVVTGKELTS